MSVIEFAAVASVAGGLAGALGTALLRRIDRLPGDIDSLAARLDAVLPQTQCGRCTYPGCRPYAEAMARGEAGPDQCPPGGDDTARALAGLLGREAGPVDRAYGEVRAPYVAVIDEERCIGCARCLPACPVDAIVGAKKRMHTVIAALCTGCELCLPPCPVDCIAMVPARADLPPADA
ncbi:MAG: RnfABCDGE type electron transport complex subunit B [Steroidobacteraceae bacterium]